MALTPRLDMRQSQSLVMTPQLMQAIQLLQMSNLDLVAYVQQELESNPLLESVSDDYSGDAGSSDSNGEGANQAQGVDQSAESNAETADGANGEGAGEAVSAPDLSDQFSGESPEQMDAISNDLDARLDNVFPR